MKKGMVGYLDRQKKIEAIKTLVAFGLVLAIFFTGYITTGTRKNLFSVVAVLGCFPASKCLVGLITRLPYRSFPVETAREVQKSAPGITLLFDLVFTTYEKIQPVGCLAIYGHTVCGYAPDERTDLAFAADHLKKMLHGNGYQKMTVKLFRDYRAFLSRAEGMSDIAAVEKDGGKAEARMGETILHLSL